MDGAGFAVSARPTHGVVSVWPTGGFIYTPDPRARLAAHTCGSPVTDAFEITVITADGVTTAIGVTGVPVSPARAAVVATIPLGDHPEVAAVSPDDSRVYVGHGGEPVVSIIDATTHTAIENVDVGAPSTDVVFSTDGRYAYVLHQQAEAVSVIDTATHSVTSATTRRRMPTTARPAADRNAVTDRAIAIIREATNLEMHDSHRTVAVDSTGRCAFVSNPLHGTVSVVEIAQAPNEASKSA